MAGDERILGEAPVVIDHREVAVTDPAMRDADLDLLGPRGPGSYSNGCNFAFGAIAANAFTPIEPSPRTIGQGGKLEATRA